MLILAVNAGVLVCLVINIFCCFKRGLILSFWDCFGTIVALLFAWYFSSYVADMIRIYPMSLTPVADSSYGLAVNRLFNGYAWMLVLFIVIKIIMVFFTPFIKFLQRVPLVKEVNQLLGAAFGVVLTWIWCLIAIFVLSMPIIENGTMLIENTILNPMLEYSFTAADFTNDFISDNETLKTILSKEELSQEDSDFLQDLMEKYGISSDWTN